MFLLLFALQHCSDSQIDFYRNSLDIALRYNPPKDSNLFGFKIADIPRLLCASPLYLADKTCQNLDDLQTMNGLFYQLHDIEYNNWEFSKGNKIFKIKMHGDRSSNDGNIVKKWCVEGKGIAAKSCLDMANELLTDKVVHLLPDYKLKTLELWLVFPSKEFITPAVHELKDFLTYNCCKLLDKVLKKLES